MKLIKIFSYLFIIIFCNQYFAQAYTSEKEQNELELKRAQTLNAQKMATMHYKNTQTEANVVHEMRNNIRQIEQEKEVLQNKFFAAQRAQEKANQDKKKLLNLAYQTFAKKHKMTEVIENNKKFIEKKKQNAKKILKLANEAKKIASKERQKAEKFYKTTEHLKEQIKLTQQENELLKNKIEEEAKRTQIWKHTFKLTRNSNKKLRDYNNKISNKKRNYKKQFLVKNHEALKLNNENFSFKTNINNIQTKLNQTLGNKPKEFEINEIDYHLDKAIPHLVKSLRTVCKWFNRSVLENSTYKLDKNTELNSLLEELNNGMQLSHNKFEKLLTK
jgi:hypothetical protein